MTLTFSTRAWADLRHWFDEDARELKRILRLIEDTRRNPSGGIGKPEQLRGLGYQVWSKRITHEHRMLYQFDAEGLRIVSLRDHNVWNPTDLV
jgi:toxin YoeB